MRLSLPPAERKRLEKVARGEFRKQNEFLERDLSLSKAEIKRVLKERDWIRHVLAVTKDPKELKIAHDSYNRKLFDIVGPEKFQVYSEFKIRRIKEFTAEFERARRPSR